MKNHSLRNWSKREAEAAAKRLVTLYLNLPSESERFTETSTVTAGDHPATTVSKRSFDKENVERLKSLLRTLSELQREARKRRIAPEEYEPINLELSRYSWVTQLEAIDRRGQPRFDNVPAKEIAEEQWSRDLSLQVVMLAQYGVLERVRPCLHCKTWFVASRRRGFFCSTPCQQKHWRSLPHVKAHKREYQAQYYRDELSTVTSRHARKHARRKKA